MQTKNSWAKIKKWLKHNLYLKPTEIALSSIFIALWLVSSHFLSINLNVMRIGITFVWMILISLTTRPILGIFTLIIGDTLSLLLSGKIARWMVLYAIIPIIIYLICYLFKKFVFQSKETLWWIMILFSISTIFLTTFLIYLFNQGFKKRSLNTQVDIDLTSLTTNIIIWTALGLVTLFQIVLLVFYYWKRNPKIKLFLSLLSLVSIVIVICIWTIGPIAQIIYLNRFFQKKDINYWKFYNIYLIARILKTIVILPFYTFIIFPIYQVSRIIVKNEEITKW